MPERPCVSRYWTGCPNRSFTRCCPAHRKFKVPLTWVRALSSTVLFKDLDVPTSALYNINVATKKRRREPPPRFMIAKTTDCSNRSIDAATAKQWQLRLDEKEKHVTLQYCFMCHRMNPFWPEQRCSTVECFRLAERKTLANCASTNPSAVLILQDIVAPPITTTMMVQEPPTSIIEPKGALVAEEEEQVSSTVPIVEEAEAEEVEEQVSKRTRTLVPIVEEIDPSTLQWMESVLL